MATRNSASACLERKSIAHDTRVAEKSRDQFGDAQAVGRAGDLGRSLNNFRGVANRVHLHDIVDVIALNLAGHAGEGNEIVGYDDHVVGVD